MGDVIRRVIVNFLKGNNMIFYTYDEAMSMAVATAGAMWRQHFIIVALSTDSNTKFKLVDIS
jgi:hypothetical protein